MSVFYQPRAPLRDPSWFFGRQRELSNVFSLLNLPAPQNVSIVGQRRIGKSWLLKKLELDGDLRAANLDEPEKYTFIYWDLQTEHQLGPDMFAARLIDHIVGNVPPTLAAVCRDSIIPDEPEESLLDILDLLELEEHRVILLLDEFAAVTSKPSFGEQFFSHLRSVFSRPAMTCVTASFRSLGEMCHLGPDSPFFNIFTRIQLRLFEMDEAAAFITEPFTEAGVEVNDAAVTAILRLTGTHPCFISQLCRDLAHDREVLSHEKLSKADVDRYGNEFRTQAFDDFTYYVNTLRRMDEELGREGSPTVDMLQNIARGNIPDSLENSTYNQLLDLSLVRESGGRPVPFSVAFSQHLKETKGTDLYFEQAFANPKLDGPNFVRLCEIALNAATEVPQSVHRDLEGAIRNIQGRPQETMRICGRDVLPAILDHSYKAQTGGLWRGKQVEACDFFSDLADKKLFPRFLASSFHTLRIAGNDGAHQTDYSEPCTAGRAFLTVLETIHVAADVYQRFPTK